MFHTKITYMDMLYTNFMYQCLHGSPFLRKSLRSICTSCKRWFIFYHYEPITIAQQSLAYNS